MTDFDQEEFWKALGRLHDETVVLRTVTTELVEVARQHGKRLDRSEVILEAILEDSRRYREERKQEAADRRQEAAERKQEALEFRQGLSELKTSVQQLAAVATAHESRLSRLERDKDKQ